MKIADTFSLDPPPKIIDGTAEDPPTEEELAAARQIVDEVLHLGGTAAPNP